MKLSQRMSAKQIASADGIVATEPSLPLHTVYYPGFYGAFFGFSATLSSEIYFCSCAKAAIENYIRLRLEGDRAQNAYPEKQFLLSSSRFPLRVVQRLMKIGISEDERIAEALQFRENLCHECNKTTPEYAYCVPMYGSVFEQHFGWYINKQSFEYGVMPVSFKILPHVCPDEIFSDSILGKHDFLNTYGGLSERDLILAQARDSTFRKQTRKMRNIIENEVRVKFGFKKVGDTWAHETLLYQLVSEVLPKEKVIRHYRATWLDNLELDIFLPNRRVGIEYQGIQHLKPIDHWGGKPALEKTKERDQRKKLLCNKEGVTLVYFVYTEDLCRELVEEKLAKFC